MSTQAPQVLSRRANGVPPASANQTSETTKGKASHDNSAPSKHRGRGSNARFSEANKTKNPTEGETSKPAKTKTQNEGEKLVIRRLPPGMTQAEFSSILGSGWDLGKGKVDWFSFAPGKISNDASKPSRPGRAYVHVTRKDDIMALSDAVRTAVWEDAKASFNSPSLIGPPSVEFAIYKKVPGNKKRTDARQGTIDQDPEFMAFLEDLANPTLPKEHLEGDEADDLAKTETKVTTTPLIEYLKEKKASKGKDGNSKGSKHGESRSGKGKGSKDDESTKKKGRESKTEKTDKTTKETVRILTKKAATESATESRTTTSQATASNTQEAVPKSRRAGIAAAARILQRDLGLSPGSAHRKARQDAAKTGPETKVVTNKESTTASPAVAPVITERPASPAKSAEAPSSSSKNRGASTTTKAQPGRRSRGGKAERVKEKEKQKDAENAATATKTPVVLLKKKDSDAEASQAAAPAPASQPAESEVSAPKATMKVPGGKGSANKSALQKKPSTVTADATRGFVKHANPSQGITEATLKQALGVYGTITFVEIDKRKGFAYVDFTEHQGLVKAVSASPVKVAQGTVQVLERKDKKPATASATPNANATTTPAVQTPAASEKQSGRGRRGRGGGGKSKDKEAGNNQAAAAPVTASGG